MSAIHAFAKNKTASAVSLTIYKGAGNSIVVGVAAGIGAITELTAVKGVSVQDVENCEAEYINLVDIYYTDSANNVVEWVQVANMSTARVYHQVVALDDGRFLVAGGQPDRTYTTFLATCEIYNPTTNTWTAAASMPVMRSQAGSAKLLNGDVLVFGGINEPARNPALASSAVYHVATNTWETVGNMPEGLASVGNLWSAVLPNGKVVVSVGFLTDYVAPKTTAIYDPVAKTWAEGADMNVARIDGTITTLADGRVLVVGGSDPANDNGIYSSIFLRSAEIYDPVADTWTLVDPMPVVPNERSGAFQLGAPNGEPAEYAAGLDVPQAVLLPNGKVLVAGGLSPTPNPKFKTWGCVGRSTCFLFDPNAAPGNQWSVTGSLHTPRWCGALRRLVDGRIIYAGGTDETFLSTPATEIYDPATGQWFAADPIPSAGFAEPASKRGLPVINGIHNFWGAVNKDNELLLCGGYSTGSSYISALVGSAASNHAALYTPSAATVNSGHVNPAHDAAEARIDERITVLQDRRPPA